MRRKKRGLENRATMGGLLWPLPQHSLLAARDHRRGKIGGEHGMLYQLKQ